MNYIFPWLGVDNSAKMSFKNGRIGFSVIQNLITQRTTNSILINTLPENMQHCLISNTTSIQDEIACINNYLDDENYHVGIYIYGLNHCDVSVERKQTQLRQMGFRNVYIYLGGLFEWLLLQDIYGKTEFPTTSVQKDILIFKP